jgi:hypothetical protein
MRPTTTTTPPKRLARCASIIEAAAAVGYRTMFKPFCSPSPQRSRGTLSTPPTNCNQRGSQRKIAAPFIRGISCGAAGTAIFRAVRLWFRGVRGVESVP